MSQDCYQAIVDVCASFFSPEFITYVDCNTINILVFSVFKIQIRHHHLQVLHKIKAGLIRALSVYYFIFYANL